MSIPEIVGATNQTLSHSHTHCGQVRLSKKNKKNRENNRKKKPETRFDTVLYCNEIQKVLEFMNQTTQIGLVVVVV